ncbi:virulence factor [Sneathiella limimaris]|uniref:virulence factor n=1 Tax=Sneathiella limimaris TaxID=1964213 RepID=UPI00146DF0C7|nr:virulence factor [Sneathiella limimaris]
MKLMLISWRDIPSQLVLKEGRKSVKHLLSDRFQEAIDRAAMRDKSHDTDDYLEGWKREEIATVSGDADALIKSQADELEGRYDASYLEKLVKSGGWEGKNG